MLNRRQFIQMGAMGLSLPQWISLGAQAAPTRHGSSGGGFGRAKSCIVLFAWGGISHIDTWDPKPEASREIRGEFNPIRTSVPGIHIGEHLPRLAQRMNQLALVRSVTHQAPSHRSAAYWNLTGQVPPNLAGNWPATRLDHPSLGALTMAALESVGDPRWARSLLPSSVCLPYPMADGGRANGQDGGFLGLKHDPVIVHPRSGTDYKGVSPHSSPLELELPPGLEPSRIHRLRDLTLALERAHGGGGAFETDAYVRARDKAYDMVLNPAVREAYSLDREPARLRDAYGHHVCGQRVMMARRLSEAGIPMVTVYCSAGDLNGSVGDHFDTHGDNFNRLKNAMLPPLDQASAALLDDLEQRGTLGETLVCWLTEFGRTPKINGAAGRDHYPNCYSVAFAGGGIRGGQVYGASDRIGAEPAESGCGPEDLHATIFQALGIDPGTTIHAMDGRPFPLCAGKALALF